jgi:3-(3-hydroxy-phenyl)propionate hydroxylase
MKTYTNPVYAYERSPDQDAPPQRRPVIIVGAGPVGLAAAIDLAQRDVPVVVLDDDNTVSVGSRAICYAKRALEILDRLGCGERIIAKGVEWKTGKIFFKDELVYAFDLLPETGHHRPAFVNLQQYYFEEYLVDRLAELPSAEIRWQHKVVEVAPKVDGAVLRIATPDGEYWLSCDWLIVADGARSPVRTMLGLEAEGQVFHDRFLIADIHMKSDFPSERWFWFDPPFHPNQSALLHRQADDVWRIDFQLGWDANPEEERKPEKILPRLRAMLGPDAQFEIEWASVYTFQCRRMKRFRHGRVLFAGDAAHLVSPFGARGANSGIQDTDNLVWKLKLVMDGLAPERLLDSYDVERTAAADENILNSTRATDFITPKSSVSRTFRDAVLALAKHHAFARRLVNSGRLSVPYVHAESPLNTADRPGETFAGAMVPGAAAADAPVKGPGSAWLLDYLHNGFSLLTFGDAVAADAAAGLARARIPCRIVQVDGRGAADRIAIRDSAGLLSERYDGKSGTCYLFRPDQHVCARWRSFDLAAVRAAIAHATCND